MKAPTTELSSDLWQKQNLHFELATDVGHWNAPEIRWTTAADTVKLKSSKCYLELYSLRHTQPVGDIMKDRSDVVKLTGTNN